MNFEERTQSNEQKIQTMSDTITDIVQFPILAAAAVGTSAVKIVQNAVEASAHAGSTLNDAMSKPIHASAQLGSAVTESIQDSSSNYWRDRISAQQQRTAVAIPQR
ncbi:MAG: hypothetical protein EAY65_06325 [Alphaproteobacteria bacterium]|nr:MAG: hypothetical protein EAY65_06325 [Alphaproteobacteria bacterium]